MSSLSDKPEWWNWPRNYRGFKEVYEQDPETGKLQKVKKPLPFKCACENDSQYGAKISGAWHWYCTFCWQKLNVHTPQIDTLEKLPQ